jgi:pathogenesis-related protein 1
MPSARGASRRGGLATTGGVAEPGGAGGVAGENDGGVGAGTTGAGGTGAVNGELEPDNMVGMTAAHNAVRAAVDTDVALPPLRWSAEVAAVAQAYADDLAVQDCALVHSGGDYGENLY